MLKVSPTHSRGCVRTFRLVAAAALSLAAVPTSAATFFFSDTPYKSAADIPTGFYASGSPDFLEDFEDGNLGGGITATLATPLGPVGSGGVFQIKNGPLSSSVDSVEYPSSGFGRSLLTTSVTFTFNSPVTAAGLVWTDGVGDYVFEAFNELGTSLGSITRNLGVAGSFQGGNDEDRFFGVTSLGGIKSISMTWIDFPFSTMELDHIQYGRAVVPPVPEDPSVIPLPAGLPLLLAGLGALGLMRRSKRG